MGFGAGDTSFPSKVVPEVVLPVAYYNRNAGHEYNSDNNKSNNDSTAIHITSALTYVTYL